MNGSCSATLLLTLVIAPVCWGQATPAPKINTASAGVQTADINAAVGVICAQRNITRSKDGTASGCRVCPKGTDFQAEAGSRWDLYAETPGHFISAQDDNLVLSGSGCDSHANNFGGSFVFSLKPGEPKLLKYDPGLITDQCNRFTLADGRDSLVCTGGWGGMGENDGVVFAVTFATTGKDSTTNLITTTDTTAMCGDDPDQLVQQADIKDMVLSSKDSSQITGLTVTATLGKVKCSSVKSEQKTGKPSAGVKTYAIEFLFDGKRFKVAPASRAALNRFSAN